MFTFRFKLCRLCMSANEFGNYSPMGIDDCDICAERSPICDIAFKGEFRSSGKDKIESCSPWFKKYMNFYHIKYPLDYTSLELIRYMMFNKII